MTTQISFRIDAEFKGRFNKLAGGECKTASQMPRDLTEGYMKERDTSASVDDLWRRIGRKLKSRGVGRKI
jgi:predicted DNA-binding protein